MNQVNYSITTPQAQLVRVAEIAAAWHGRPDKLMDVILEVQHIVPALAEDVAAVIAREMGISQNDVYSFVTFYSLLPVRPSGRHTIRACSNAPCHVRGSKAVMQGIEDFLKIRPGETTEDGMFTYTLCSCLGICDSSPAIMIDDKPYGNLNYESVQMLLKRYIREDVDAWNR
ncbi:MAG: NAD(P)H-dependent oxidoreductase subunit E [Oscillospiraceae bacterium]|nr:NAD(P)H-dependent oxidoreductase subunit E [Oscillospiraceae bacterium]